MFLSSHPACLGLICLKFPCVDGIFAAARRGSLDNGEKRDTLPRSWHGRQLLLDHAL
jgi:hypothetical protein